MANTGALVLSLSVPPRWNVASELNVASAAFVAQLRSVTWTNHVPSSPLFDADFSDCASPIAPDPNTRAAAAQITAATRAQRMLFEMLQFIVILLLDQV